RSHEPQRVLENLGRIGLRDVAECAEVDATQDRVAVGLRGQHDGRRVRAQFAQRGQSLEAFDVGQAEIEQREVPVRVRGQQPPRVGEAEGCVDLAVRLDRAQGHPYRVEYQRVVVDDQYPHALDAISLCRIALQFCLPGACIFGDR